MIKLLFDQNLSPRLVNRLADLYPNSNHLHNLELDTIYCPEKRRENHD
ncbi:MAG: DUF5615 family PIN-like protein [Xenococcaceae cyanobacterium MO_188.B32]|nr:DUF5615 family PIN-like protein [Xenococcaceae cyanobacterium MO_188.B32]